MNKLLEYMKEIVRKNDDFGLDRTKEYHSQSYRLTDVIDEFENLLFHLRPSPDPMNEIAKIVGGTLW